MQQPILLTQVFKGLAFFLLIVITSCSENNKKKPVAEERAMATEDFYAIKVKTIDGADLDLHQFKGKKILIVNTASECGFTPQYKDLEELHLKYGNKVVLLAFPCNDFGEQEPGSHEEIKTFCSKNYHTTFQLMSKIVIRGSKAHPLYQWLTDPAKNGWNDKLPSWNFSKYLIDEKGQLIKFYPSSVKPLSPEIVDAL